MRQPASVLGARLGNVGLPHEGLGVRRFIIMLLIGATALVGAVSPAVAGSSPLADVLVSGVVGEAPTLEFSEPFSTNRTVSREVTVGTGATVTKGARVLIDFLVVDARTGKKIESSFGVGHVSVVRGAEALPSTSRSVRVR